MTTSGFSVNIVPNDELPQTRSRPFFDLLDRTLSDEITRQIGKPFWIDTVGTSNLVDIRIKLDNAVMHVLARRSQTYASNSQIFLLWMLGTSLVLLTVAILFLRNQIKPILRLAEAAESLGKGRPTPPDFRPRGAREVRQAAQAFIEMRDRIERHVEQRTTMLAGVSHDLRTVLTRFKLQLAMFEESPELDAMRADVDEMQAMLEDYVAFAKGASGEEIVRTDISEILTEVRNQAHGKSDIRIDVGDAPLVVPLGATPSSAPSPISSTMPCASPTTSRSARDERMARLWSRSRTTGQASPKMSAIRCSGPFTGSMTPAIRMPNRPALAWPSPAISPASMAATLP